MAARNFQKATFQSYINISFMCVYTFLNFLTSMIDAEKPIPQ